MCRLDSVVCGDQMPVCWLPVHWLLLQEKCYYVPKLPAKHLHKCLLAGASLFQQESGSAARLPRREALNLTAELLAGPDVSARPGAVLGQDTEWSSSTGAGVQGWASPPSCQELPGHPGSS